MKNRIFMIFAAVLVIISAVFLSCTTENPAKEPETPDQNSQMSVSDDSAVPEPVPGNLSMPMVYDKARYRISEINIAFFFTETSVWMKNIFSFQYNTLDKLVRFSTIEEIPGSPDGPVEFYYEFKYDFLQYIETITMTDYSGEKSNIDFDNSGDKWSVTRKNESGEPETKTLDFPYSYMNYRVTSPNKPADKNNVLNILPGFSTPELFELRMFFFSKNKEYNITKAADSKPAELIFPDSGTKVKLSYRNNLLSTINYFDNSDKYFSSVDLSYDKEMNLSVLKKYDSDGKLQFSANFSWENRSAESILGIF